MINKEIDRAIPKMMMQPSSHRLGLIEIIDLQHG